MNLMFQQVNTNQSFQLIEIWLNTLNELLDFVPIQPNEAKIPFPAK